MLARRVKAIPKLCFDNCRRAVENLDTYAGATYVEGFAVAREGPKMALEHAWLEFEGVILDPTLPDRDLVYFPSLRFSGREGLAAAAAIPKKDWDPPVPIFFRFGFGGYDHPEFRAARETAEKLAYGVPA